MITEKTNRSYSEVLRDLIGLLVTHPDQLKIHESFAGTITKTGQSVICINVSTDYEDRPQIIGRGGMRVRALQHILNLVAARRNERINLSVANKQTEGRQEKPLPPIPTWDHDDEVRGILERLLEDLTDTVFFVELVSDRAKTNIFLKLASRDVIDEELLKMLQQLFKSYGLVRGWRVYLSLQFLNEQ